MALFGSMGIGFRLEYSLDLLLGSDEPASLEKALSDVRTIYGLSHVAFHVTNIPNKTERNPLIILTYPKQWVDTYVDKNYFDIDPVVEVGRYGFLPVDWAGLNRQPPRVAQFFKEAESFGIGRHGLTMTVRGPGGERSLFSVTSNVPDADWMLLRKDTVHDMQILAHYVHERAMILSGYRQSPRISLSSRQKQCLELLARGKQYKAIASDLRISESAVHLYLGAVRGKLGVARTSEAIAKAISLELIEV